MNREESRKGIGKKRREGMRRKESSHCYGNGQLKSLEINLDTDEWRLNGMRHVEEGQRQCSQSMGMGMT